MCQHFLRKDDSMGASHTLNTPEAIKQQQKKWNDKRKTSSIRVR